MPKKVSLADTRAAALAHLGESERREAHAMAGLLDRLMLADTVQERLRKDGKPDLADLINADNVEAVLAEAVEGENVIDDAEVHRFFRKLLDDHRQGTATLDAMLGD